MSASHPPNALARASSSYLRSAMHQPIQWHEWDEEAFAKAKAENKPILLDIGAVWCHWCHVMDRESYDDPEVAQIVNEHFIAVKVDRDERPDIDSRYQAAVGALTGQGGWPLTGFLIPDGKPFYGGTYFPPEDQYGRPSFKRVLLAIAQAYRHKHGEVISQASQITNVIEQSESFSGHSGSVSASLVDSIVTSSLKLFDERNGGFGTAPKFPHPSALDLLIEHYSRSGDENVLECFTTTLKKMAAGGVCDQLAGGFHRYSVDAHWIVPHFEKMCYDNSELLKNYVHAWQVTKDEFFADVARDIIRWMDEWLSDRERGGFYASQDADYSMHDDGDYFTWTRDEARDVLSPQELEVAALHYDIHEVGEMHHNPAKNVLYVRADLNEISRRTSRPAIEVMALLDSAKRKMYAARKARPTPYVDKTLYTGWNAMCVSAYLAAGRTLDLQPVVHFALRSLDRLLSEGIVKVSAASSGDEQAANPTLRHVIAYSDSAAERRDTEGVLDDYAFTILACLDAYEATADLTYFGFAQRLAVRLLADFADPVSGGFFDIAATTDRVSALGMLGTRRKPFQDSPTPAGNSVAAIAMLRLFAYTNDRTHHDRAQRTLELFAGNAEKYGMFAATYGLAVAHVSRSHTQVIIVGEDESADRLLRSALISPSLHKSVIRMASNQIVARGLPPALSHTLPEIPALREKKSFVLVCSGFSCKPPVFTVDALEEELRNLLHLAA